MDKLYYQPNHLWKGQKAIRKLKELSKAKPKVVKQWLSKQAFWQVHLPPPKRIDRPHYEVTIPNEMHQKANKSDHLADYLDLTFIIDSGGKLSTRLYDKRDDFDFHIVNFPFLSSNIPSGPSYGVYISQLIRYARCCSHYDDFRCRHKCLVDRLLSQGYKALRLEKSFKKFYGRYQDLIEKYRRSVNAMVSDSFPGQFLFNM